VEFRYVNELAHRTVRFGCVELYGAFKSNRFYYQFGELTDGQFLAGSDIDVAIADFT
jgi:hypothetical protein